jgi:O-antigen ligase
MLAFLKDSLTSREGSERILWILLLLFVTSISFSIAVSHIFLTATAVVYLYRKFRYDPHFPRAPILGPALALAYFIMLSAVFSIHPSQSLIDAKDLALFIIIPIVFDTVRNLDDVRVVYGILILAGVISALYGLYQFWSSDAEVINSRIRGFMGHWMTFSGLLMILNVLLLSHLLFARVHPKWFYPAFLILSAALLFSLTRNVWMGFLAAAVVLIALRRVRWVIAVPAVVALVFLGSLLIWPSSVGARMTSIFNPAETSNRDRLLMLQSGWKIIKDYPLTGVGTGMIEHVYPRYRAPDSVFRNNQHLHNNLVQVAAENGLFALAAWLWLIFKVVYDLIHWKRRVMNDEEKFMIHGTLGIVVSLFVAGMFEYNFGDSEIKMLFLVLITLPYAWHKNVRYRIENGAQREAGPVEIPVPVNA